MKTPALPRRSRAGRLLLPLLCACLILPLMQGLVLPVRAETAAPAVGDKWSDIDTDALAAAGYTVVDDRDAGIDYTWPYTLDAARRDSSEAIGGTLMWQIGQVSATVRYEFSGSFLAVLYAENYYAAEVYVNIDGQTYQAETPFNRSAPQADFGVGVSRVVFARELPDGDHVVTITHKAGHLSGEDNVKPDGNAYYDNDALFNAFIVRGNQETPAPERVEVGSKTALYTDDMLAGWNLRVIDNTDPDVIYTWPYDLDIGKINNHSSAYGHSLAFNVGQVSATITTIFEGTYLALAFADTYYACKVIVDIDGRVVGEFTPHSTLRPETSDVAYQSRIRFVKDDLLPGYHIVTIQHETAYESGEPNTKPDGNSYYDNNAYFDCFIVQAVPDQPVTEAPTEAPSEVPTEAPTAVPTDTADETAPGEVMTSHGGPDTLPGTGPDRKSGCGASLKGAASVLALLLTVCLLLTGCRGGDGEQESGTDGQGEPETPAASAAETPTEAETEIWNTQKGERQVDTLMNYLSDMGLSDAAGTAGGILANNEKAWVQQLLTDNPGLFAGFYNQRDSRVFKCMWHGEFPGKLLTGVAKTYLLHNDPVTREIGDSMVASLKEAQGPDGYLGPWNDRERFDLDVTRDPNATGKWDTWGHFHCIYGLVRWYQATGNTDALDVAVKAADCVYDYFIAGNRPIAGQKWAETNLAIGYGFAVLYEETGDEKYLEAAKHIVDVDWKVEYPDFYSGKTVSCDWMTAALTGKPYYASGQPRWEGLYALETLAALYRITGEQTYMDAMDSLWWGMVGSDRHNTGSFGTGEGASGDPYGTGSETCNTCAWMAFSTEYLKVSKNSRVADELELSFFNAALGSLLDGDRNFTYMNNSDGTREAARIVLEPHSFRDARDMSCCQANGNSGIAQIADWALLTDAEGLYLSYYGASEMHTRLADGTKVVLTQTTDYPKTGSIRVTVGLDAPASFALRLRVPAWSENTRISVNGQTADGVSAGSWCCLERTWQDGDVIDIDLDMSVHFWVRDCGKIDYKVSAYWGPVLLAFRSSDDLRPTTNFQMSALRSITPCEGDGIVNFTVVRSDGTTAMLTDYCSAGKDGQPYVSWLTSVSTIDAVPFDRNAAPVWCRR
ncbi:MAG: glycoside hydrolase family 127 protein [Clostridia bacterium]|nr:glycoside hydrolase family 127 protein [Clostridia bacterium]